MPYLPPPIWYGKKWIPVTWLPWESARIFSDATASQMHSPAMRNPAFTSKSAMSQIRGEPHDFLKLLPLHASKNILHHNLHYPSSWLKMVQDYLCHYVNLVTTDRNSGKCATLLHGQMYLQEKTPVLQFGHTLEQNSSICPSISYLWMVDLVMPYIHRLVDQPPLNHNRQKLISCHCTSGSFQEKNSGPFLVWYFFPGPISCPGTLTHCLLDFWKIVLFKKRTEPPGKKTGSTEEGDV